MAFEMKITTGAGVVINNAYVRVDTVCGYKFGLDISVNSYVTQEAFEGGQGYLEQKFYNLIPSVEDDAPNFIKQGYIYLKTLPEFEDAIDVLE